MFKAGKTDDKKLTGLARWRRQKPTASEALLWECLRGRKLEGHKFKRQFPVGSYIVDFVCLERNLVVEIDGFQHRTREGAASDRQRDLELLRSDLRVLRFTNREVKDRLEMVLEKIREWLNISLPPPSPAPGGRGSAREAGRGEGLSTKAGNQT